MLKNPYGSRVSPHLFDLVRTVMHAAATDRLDEKNFYAFNPSFDKGCGCGH